MNLLFGTSDKIAKVFAAYHVVISVCRMWGKLELIFSFFKENCSWMKGL